MSKWLRDRPVELTHLSYEAREVACHSIDSYREKLIGDSHYVKVHCHRATVETILRKHGMRRPQIKISRSMSKRPFLEYATAVLKGLDLPISELERDGEEKVAAMLERWREVSAFFMLRLSLAPCVETLLLLDRIYFLTEQGFVDTSLRPIFDPAHSPRNILISSLKISTWKH